MAIHGKSIACVVSIGLALTPAAAAGPGGEAALSTVARFLARTAILFQIGTGVAEAAARGSATVDPLSIKLDAAHPGVSEAVILAAMADAHATGSHFTGSSMVEAQDKLRAGLTPGQVEQLATIVQPIVTYLDRRLAEASAESGTPKAALLTSGYGVAIEESERRSARLTRQRGGRSTLDALRALRHSLAAAQAAGIPGLACHAARAGRTAGAAYLKGQGAPANVIAEFAGQPPSPAIPFDRACKNGATTG
jgi:hypothetical protein